MKSQQQTQNAPRPNHPAPVQEKTPWPTFRRDRRNSGLGQVCAQYHGDKPWSVTTGKGIFSTPVIDQEGTIYFGSADHYFYAVSKNGKEKWRFKTGEIIDSAGALLSPAPDDGDETIVFPSGDGLVYKLRSRDGSTVWTFGADREEHSYNNWFEGNISVGKEGTLYAGNTNFNYYAIHPDGSLKWTYKTGANAWSAAAISDDGTIYWGSCDTFVRAVRPDGTEIWRKRTLGFIAASAAVGSDGTVYIGSFDSYLYALHPRTGKTKWKFKTHDHIYSSAALATDARGQTSAIYVGSTDGALYALDTEGRLLWSFDIGAPIRSSPVLGRKPEGEEGFIVYVGGGNGQLYALDAENGKRRWSFDTTPEDPELRDRNDLNGSPALGRTGIYIGGEHGRLWYVPYDYPLHADDPRAATDPVDDCPDNVSGLFYVTSGGRMTSDRQITVPAATIITLRLLVRHKGSNRNARLFPWPVKAPARALNITLDPPCRFRWEISADGRHFFIIPEGFLRPGTLYTLKITANYYTGGLHIGNLTLGGRKAGRLNSTFSFQVAGPEQKGFPLAVQKQRTGALIWTRLAVPIPTMLPSLNQIGFDYMNWILGTVMIRQTDGHESGNLIVWAVGGKRNAKGELVVDPDTDFTLPLSGRFQDDCFILTNRNFKMAVTGIPIPFTTFQIRGQLGRDLIVKPGATAFAETKILSIPTFGPLMVIAGLASGWWKKLLAACTFITRPYEGAGKANLRPGGIHVGGISYDAPTRSRDGRVEVKVDLEPGVSYSVNEHRGGILLLDEDRMEPVVIDYHAGLTNRGDENGNLSSVSLRIPGGTPMPRRLSVMVILDVFPMERRRLQ